MKQCKHCPEPVEAERYEMCKECWWDRDPRNVKNGGTVDLSKWTKVEPKEQLIMVKMYSPERDEFFFTHVTLSGLAQNPNNVSLELLGLHFINMLRHGQGLEPLSHNPIEESRGREYFTGNGKK